MEADTGQGSALCIVVERGGDERAAARLAERTGIPAQVVRADSALGSASMRRGCEMPAACTSTCTATNAVGHPDARRGAARVASDVPGLVVRFGAEGVSLEGDGMVMRPDFSTMLPRLKPGRLNRELLVRAAKLKHAAIGARLLAVDATAGLGEDALLLAAAGFEVLLFEQDPVIAALLADSMDRAAGIPQLTDAVSRMRLAGGDSIAALPHLERTPDVVYLDPMFPERRKSAAVKKKFQLIHRLERPCENQEELVAAALAARPRKIVIKRPVKGPYLAGIKPSYSIAGKAVRYDCLVP